MTYSKMFDFAQHLRLAQNGTSLVLFLSVLIGLWRPGGFALAAATEMLSAKTAVIEEGVASQIDWTQGIIRSIGSQPPISNSTGVEADQKQFSLAKSQAQQQLLGAIKEIRIRSNHLVGDVLGNQQIMAELQTLIVDTPSMQREYLSDRTVRVILSIPLHGAISQLLLPHEIQPIQPITAGNGIGEAIASNGIYTGLIVDARALEVQPMLVPEIVDDAGEPVYGPAFVSREFVVSRGMASYVRQQNSIGYEERVGLNPLIIHGLKLANHNNGAIVVSSVEAAKVREVSDHLELLRQCRVIIWVH